LSVCARDAAVPLVAIGGITQESAERIAKAGASVALIGALLPDSTLGSEEAYAEITRRTVRLAALFRSAAS
jgi:thiamine monophosphate synthase